MLKTVLLFAAQCSVAILMAGVEPTTHHVNPKDGDGIYSLLRRYSLEGTCDKEQFLRANKLTEKSNIHKHQKYELPVLIYRYDGKSIRSTIGNNNWEKALRIQKYNETLLAKGARKSSYTTSKILWVPYSEIHCDFTIVESTKGKTKVNPKVAIPPTSSTTTQDLFGKKYAKVDIIDNTLKNKVYYVVSGHGGPDPGAQCIKCPSTLCEDEYAYDIALRLARNLMQHGAIVHMVVQDKNDGIRDHQHLQCDRDETVAGQKLPQKQKPRLVQRAATINKLYRDYKKSGKTDQTAIFLHVDSNTASKRQDVFFYHHKKSKTGKKLAQQIRDTFDRKYKKHQKNRGYKGYVKPRGLYVLNYTQPTSVFVELANIRNKSDHRRILLNSNRQAVANWLYEGLAGK